MKDKNLCFPMNWFWVGLVTAVLQGCTTLPTLQDAGVIPAGTHEIALSSTGLLIRPYISGSGFSLGGRYRQGINDWSEWQGALTANGINYLGYKACFFCGGDFKFSWYFFGC